MSLSDSSSRCVVIFAGSPHAPSAIEHVEAVAQANPAWRFVVVQQHPPRPPRGRWLRAKLRRLRREPVSYPLELAGQLAGRLLHAAPAAIAGTVALPARFEDIRLPNVAVHSCVRLHDADTLAHVGSLRPWLGLAIGAPILRPDLFRIPRLGTLNLHKGLLPDYRGMPPGFWELHDGVACSGVTVHWVDEGLDTGPILIERRLSVPAHSTVAGLAAALDRLGTETLIDALRRIETHPTPGGTAIRRAPSQAHRRPSWRVARSVRRRLARRRRPSRSFRGRLRCAAKHVVLAAYVYLWAPLRNRIRARRGLCHATVLLYHRVSDELLDSVTVGVEQFWRQLELLRRHYDVTDLPALLARRGQPRTRPCVAITFDDGYADNLRAAMLLRRAGMPAMFFLSTSIVGSDGAFPHDLQSLGRRIEPLTWEQARQMAGWGFDFGNHTEHHTRLSAVAPDDALREIQAAEQRLDAELHRNGRPRCLAYPYGRETDCTDLLRRLLAGAGIAACLSAYGGVNPPDFDPMNVRRQAVDHSFSPLAFRAAVEGWRSRA